MNKVFVILFILLIAIAVVYIGYKSDTSDYESQFNFSKKFVTYQSKYNQRNDQLLLAIVSDLNEVRKVLKLKENIHIESNA